MNFSGRRVLVAGGAGGIGTALTQELLSRGAKVIVITRSQERFDDMKKKMPANLLPSLSVIVADVTTEEGVKAVFDQSTQQPGGVQHVVASVGSWWQGGKLVEQSLEEFNKGIKDRVTGHFLLLKTFSAYLEKQKDSTYTMLTGGAEDHYIVPGISLLCVTSGALRGFSEAARAEFKDSNMAFCDFKIYCRIHPKPDSEMSPSDPYNMGNDLIARGIVATMVARARDRKDVRNRHDAQALAK
ncbi:uncharacterized protein LOC143281432 [Babylonia areolata]|uniref:uncharacterized protein LOC143281432 n=1 Tax=Babylonia areolata TaxID=304850 RepID=UPI003FD62AAA